MKSTEASSQQDAVQAIGLRRQYASICSYSACPNSSARLRSPFVSPKGDLARLRQLFGRVDDVDRALLELDALAARETPQRR